MNRKVFISYSWDSDDHRSWVRKLADSIEEIKEIHVTWDGYDLDALTDKNLFMESGISESDYVIVVATKRYKEKADTRAGGVGIETYLTTAAHWDVLQKGGKTKVIVVLREPDAVPNYLKGHLYIDFSNDAEYPLSETKLLKYFRGDSTTPRPPKRKSLASDDHLYTFTKIEDLIRVGHTNRRALVNKEQGTDFSGQNRIKYELWETKSPALGYYLALAANINISQTVSHAIQQLKSLTIRPSELTVLRPRAGRAEQALISSLFEQAGFNTQIHEFTYKDYIWRFCIDESLKGIDSPSEVPNYTDQSTSYQGEEGNVEYAKSARDLLVGRLQQSSTTSAHLVVASGGMGKTSLCLAVAGKLHNRQDLHSSVVLIQAESIKRYVAEHGGLGISINSIFQLYELYARHHHFDQVFDRNTFELAFLSGNLVVIIDGLDEFVSLFPDSFSLDSFLGSLAEFHKELGSSAVLLTTRNSDLVDLGLLQDLKIEKHDLLGFDRASCESYLNRRFKKYSNGQAIAQKVQVQIEKVQLKDHDGRVVPFFADIAATVTEDALKDDKSEEFEITEDPTPYPSNNELTDHIIHSVLRREEIRHGLDLTVSEIVELLSGLVVDFSKRWLKSEMQERLTLLYDSRGAALTAKISLNPLLVQSGDYIELRYSFLASYFEVAHLLDGILRQSLEREFIRSLARLSTESNEFREVRRYFLERRETLLQSAGSLISKLRPKSGTRNQGQKSDDENARRAIASLLSLCAEVAGGSALHITELIFRLYGVSYSEGMPNSIKELYLCGDFPAMDFSNLTIFDSRFSSYKKLLSCKFKNTKFISCKFDYCFDLSVTSSTLEPQHLDSTCDIGDLKDFLTLASAGKQDEAKLVEIAARKFLHSFFKGDRFIDNNKAHIKFSTRVPGLADNKFDRLIGAGYIAVKREKEVDTFYEIAQTFRPSVRRLLTDNYPDSSMRKFFAFLHG